MTADVAIVTAIYDSYDTLKPALPQIDVDVEWVCVTDDQALGESAAGWRVVQEPRPGVHPNRAAKRPKMRPWDYTDAPVSIWVDASFRVVSATFAADATAFADPIAQFVHPWRGCIYDEAAASTGIPKYAGEPVQAQVQHYLDRGFPRGWGLWATGVIARRHTPAVREFGERWLAECTTWSFQDQVSHPVALQAARLRPAPLPGTHLSNNWLSYQGSGRH